MVREELQEWNLESIRRGGGTSQGICKIPGQMEKAEESFPGRKIPRRC